MKKLDEKLNKLVNFINEFYSINSYMPSMREIAKHLNVKSTSTVSYYIKKLEENGLLQKKSSVARAYNIKNSSTNTDYIKTTILDDNIKPALPTCLQIPKKLFSGTNLIIYINKGDAMADIGIMDGDYVVIDKSSAVVNGDVALIKANDKLLCRRYFKEKNGIRLSPENTTMEPIYLNDCTILGKVVGAIRNKIV